MTQRAPVVSGTLTANLPSLLLLSWLFFLCPSPKRLVFRSMPGTKTCRLSLFFIFSLNVTFTFQGAHVSVVFLPCSALSVMGTWYVTIVVIVKYIWPDKDMTPSYGPTRWGLQPGISTLAWFTVMQLMAFLKLLTCYLSICLRTFFERKHLHLCHLALLQSVNHCVCYSSASWTAVFNAMPTICFGFQVWW